MVAVIQCFFSVIPFFLTVPNTLSSLGTVYVYNIANAEGKKFEPLHLFQVRISNSFPQTSFYPQTSWLGPDDILKINLWLYSVVMKLIPCLVLAVFTSLLIRAMYQAEAQSLALSSTRRCSIRPLVKGGRRNSTRRSRSTDRTTRLLIALLVLFLLSETPLVGWN